MTIIWSRFGDVGLSGAAGDQRSRSFALQTGHVEALPRAPPRDIVPWIPSQRFPRGIRGLCGPSRGAPASATRPSRLCLELRQGAALHGPKGWRPLDSHPGDTSAEFAPSAAQIAPHAPFPEPTLRKKTPLPGLNQWPGKGLPRTMLCSLNLRLIFSL